MENEKESKKSKKWLGLLFVILVIIAVVAGGYYYLKVKTSPKNVFKAIVEDEVSKAGNIEQCDTLKSSVKLSGKLDTEKEEYKQISTLLNNAEVTIDSQTNYKDKTEKLGVKINKDGNEALNGNIYFAEGDNNLYVYLEGILDKYFKADLNKIDEKGELKDSLNAMFDASSNEKIGTIKEIIEDVINNKLTDKYFSQENVEGLKKSTLKLTYEELKNIVKEISEDLQKNEKFLAAWDNPTEIKEYLSEFVKKIDNNDEKYNKIVIEISIYTKGLLANEFVKAEFTVLDENSKVAFFLNKVDDKTMEFSLKITNNENNMKTDVETLTGTLKIDKYGKNEGNIGFNVKVPELGDLTLNVDYKTEQNAELEKVDVANSVDYFNMTQNDAATIIQNLAKLPSYNLIRLLFNSYFNQD